MFEIPDAQARAKILAELGGVEQTIKMEIGKEIIYAKPEDDVDRTSSAGKTSSVHFIHFLMNPAQVSAFKRFRHETWLLGLITLITAIWPSYLIISKENCRTISNKRQPLGVLINLFRRISSPELYPSKPTFIFTKR